ncbi:MAG: hypothetical protein DRP35_07240 [Candidatus Zixiibacteriota bacterium]|nr:MAG: hypothetical protein DRP35_07240 [candidate division Zixibacteria bacterium]
MRIKYNSLLVHILSDYSDSTLHVHELQLTYEKLNPVIKSDNLFELTTQISTKNWVLYRFLFI